MFGLNNMPPVTKNLLIINVLVYLVALFSGSGLLPIAELFPAHYFNSPLFEPYQVVTHMFMHSMADPFHILFNMLLLAMFGGHLERIWGAKRYFIFYIVCGISALMLYNSIGVYQIMQLQDELLAQGYNLDHLNYQFSTRESFDVQFLTPESEQLLYTYRDYVYSSMAGASGAIFGLLAAFALLFPNTQLMLLFPPIPIKAKYLIGGYLVFEIYSSLRMPHDQIAHLAHVGGAIAGIVMVLIWRRTDRNNFY